MKRRKRRSKKGAFIAEFTAVLVFGLPLLVLLSYVGLECAQFYAIKSAMETAARAAARKLVIQYNLTGNKNTVVDLRTDRFINNGNQFTVTWDTATQPTFVTVTCAYPTGGGGGLPEFPCGPLAYMQKANATFNLQAITVQGTFTLPIQ
jgi:Flp pilus assembly protein TadG